MAYFNHAFQKAFVGTSQFTDLAGGKLGTAGNVLTTGQFGFVNSKTWDFVATNAAPEDCCPLILVAGSLYQNDKIGPFHGGYQESNKSKIINPRFISRFYRVDNCSPQQAQITVGGNVSNYDPESPNYNASCFKEFLCGETYYLRVDIKGSPVLRTLSRNTYYTADAYTGCCDPAVLAPTAVNPLVVYSKWAYNLLNSPLISPFINIQITYSIDNGLNWAQLAPSAAYVDNGVSVPAGASTDLDLLLPFVEDPSTLPANVVPADTLAGLIITGGYIDTRFGDCTFYPNDSVLAYIEPVKPYASEVDYTGDPCVFQGLCVNNVCAPIQGSGFGENVLREVIQSEMYSQNYFYTGMDLRIREITQGYDVSNAIMRTNSYTRYFIQHNVPRFNNPTGVFDNDQYLLEIVGQASATTVAVGANVLAVITVADVTNITAGMVVSVNGGAYSTQTVSSVNALTNEVTMSGTVAVTDGQTLFFLPATLAEFEAFVTAWLEACGDGCAVLETYTCPTVCEEIPAVFTAEILE